MRNDVNIEENEIECEIDKNDERGASLVEYALLVALIAIICIVAVKTAGQQVSTNFSAVNTELQTYSN